ncbi:proclotting enzyme-like [Myzus persicae]|uniref:proclotting enzyme-like n=1 Tax=Myzus persicae TaxID=13164 RepID=UPI000B933683|nr:proclotting enzyme-like [Myzus persicae]
MYVSYIFCYALLVALASSSTFTPPDILWLDEKEVCKKSLISGKTHVCKVLDDCKTAIQDIRDNVKYPTICSFKGKMPVVCCAPETVTREERLAIDEPVPQILPGITLHFDSYKNGLVEDNLITYSRPRRQIVSRIR